MEWEIIAIELLGILLHCEIAYGVADSLSCVRTNIHRNLLKLENDNYIYSAEIADNSY